MMNGLLWTWRERIHREESCKPIWLIRFIVEWTTEFHSQISCPEILTLLLTLTTCAGTHGEPLVDDKPLVARRPSESQGEGNSHLDPSHKTPSTKTQKGKKKKVRYDPVPMMIFGSWSSTRKEKYDLQAK